MNSERIESMIDSSGGGLMTPAMVLLFVVQVLPATVAFALGLPNAEIVALLFAGTGVTAIQSLVLLLCAARMRRRTPQLLRGEVPRLPGLIRWFAPGVAVGLTLLGISVWPVAATVISIVAGFDTSALLAQFGTVWAAIQFVAMLALHRLVRGWMVRQLSKVNFFKGPGQSSQRHLAPAAIWVVVIPAVVVSFGLGWGAEQVLRSETADRSAVGYQRLTEAVLTANPLPSGSAAAGLIDVLTPFDQAAPFVRGHVGTVQGAIDPTGRQVLEREVGQAGQGAKVELESGLIVAWTTLADGETVVGVLHEIIADPRSPYIVISLILASAFGAALIALWLGGRVRNALVQRATAIDAAPDHEPPPLSSTTNLELGRLDAEIARACRVIAERRTDRAEMVVQHREAREKKARVFTGMSHDLRSPLNSVIGFTDLLLKGIDGELEPRQRAAISSISQEAERLLVLIGDILDMAKLEAGRLELERAWVPSVEILTECEVGAQRLVASRDISFSSELQPGLPPVLVDKDRLLQALLSLVCRAVDSMESGTVQLKAWRHADKSGGTPELRVDIIDSGGALSKESRKKLAGVLNSDREQSPQPGSETIGLGITLARRIARLHGGDVTYTTADGGSVFTVIVPLDESADGA